MRLHLFLLIVGVAALFYSVLAVERGAAGGTQADKLFARATADDFMGDSGCVECHGSKVANFASSPHAALVADPKLPLSKRGCEGCHGPGKIHIAEESSPSARCLRKSQLPPVCGATLKR